MIPPQRLRQPVEGTTRFACTSKAVTIARCFGAVSVSTPCSPTISSGPKDLNATDPRPADRAACVIPDRVRTPQRSRQDLLRSKRSAYGDRFQLQAEARQPADVLCEAVAGVTGHAAAAAARTSSGRESG